MFEDDDGDAQEGQGVLDRSKRTTEQRGIVPVQTTKRALDRVSAVLKEGASRLQKYVAGGQDVQSDAQRLMILLASFGEGDRMGKFAFSSCELLGLKYDSYMTPEVESFEVPDKVGPGTHWEKRTVAVIKKRHDPYDSEHDMHIPPNRLRDAVAFLVSKKYAETRADRGENPPGIEWDEVVLTANGREAAQSFVKKAVAAELKGASIEDMNLFDDGEADYLAGAFGAEKTHLQAFQDMLSGAKVKYAVDHLEGEETKPDAVAPSAATFTTLTEVDLLKYGVTFTFSADGKLSGVSKAKDEA